MVYYQILTMDITDLNCLENIKNKNYSFNFFGGNAISVSAINGFSEGMSYTSLVGQSKVIAISLPNDKFSHSFASISSVAT